MFVTMETGQKQDTRSLKKKVRRSGPAQTKIGRPAGTFKDVDLDRLTRDVARGVPVQIATAAVGISSRTFHLWLDERPEFAQRLAIEKQAVICEALDAIKSCSTKEREFRHLTWFLERVYPDAFAPPQHNTPSFIQNNLQLGSLDEVRQILDEAKKLPYRQQPAESPRLTDRDTEQ